MKMQKVLHFKNTFVQQKIRKRFSHLPSSVKIEMFINIMSLLAFIKNKNE